MDVQANGSVNLILTKNEALVLYDLVSRINESQDTSLDPGEQRVLFNIEASFERVLLEPLAPNYIELVRAARRAVAEL